MPHCNGKCIYRTEWCASLTVWGSPELDCHTHGTHCHTQGSHLRSRHAWHTLSIDPKLPKLLKQHILKQTPVCWPMELPFSTHTQLGRCTTVNCSAQCWFHTGCGFSKIAHKTEILSCPPVLLWCVRLHVYECYCSVSALCMLLLYECSVHTHGWVQ